MATIAITVTETSKPTLNKTYTLADADMNAVVDAFQSDANVSINGTASRAQVMNFIMLNVWMNDLKIKTQSFQTVPAVVPAPIAISE